MKLSLNKLINLAKNPKVLILVVLTLASILWVFVNGGPFGGGLKFGIDFAGGTKIPVLLAHPVDQITMQNLVENIKVRTATFGLTEIKVTPIGDSEVHIEVSKLNPELVSNIEAILSRQGIFEGIVDGKVALSGEEIYQDTVRQLNPLNYRADWVVGFSLTKDGQEHFAKVVKGKANYPIYMFLDKPTEGLIVISKKILNQSIEQFHKDQEEINPNYKSNRLNISESDVLKALIQATKFENANVKIVLEEDLIQNLEQESIKADNFVNATAYISSDSSSYIQKKLIEKGFQIVQKPSETFIPKIVSSTGFIYISRWDVVGLRSAAILSPEVTDGSTTTGSYIISGYAQGQGNKKILDAELKAKELVAVLKGGALPVKISLGSAQEVPPVFGQEILKLSLSGLVFALIFISLFVAFRYKNPLVVFPIVFVSVCEIIILTAIIGMFSIDLAAMAGIIAATGISVDAQIVITDNVLRRKENLKEGMDYSFQIIFTNAAVAILAFLPLVVISGLVEIIGFGSTTILGYLLGVFVSRPAYGAIVAELIKE
ncbi:MAG: hypothetical protein N3D10_01485 [Candidatus Micrarchaeota archaeon]|nr:hypothetical protein [Candidatus Micrarchaeota archaeon]